MIVSPDAGGIKLVSAYGGRLGCSVAVLYKERLNAAQTAVSKVVGDVRGKACVIADDMISTGGTIKSAIEALLQAGFGRKLHSRRDASGFYAGTTIQPELTRHPAHHRDRLESGVAS